MSEKGSPREKKSGKEIPVRRIVDISNIPSDYSTTPGGSIFSTTPGGTRIFYNRDTLLQYRNSPLTRSPPPNMAKIPGVTAPGEVDLPKENGTVGDSGQEKKEVQEEAHQFQMDI